MADTKTKTSKKAPVKKAAPKAVKTSKTASKAATPKKAATKKVVKAETKPVKSATTAKSVKKTVSLKEAKNAPRFAVIKLAGSQVKVVEGMKYEVKKLDGNKGDKLEVMEVLLTADGENVKVGKPYVAGAKVTLVIDSQKKGEKVRVFKYKAKARYRRAYGSRELITRVEVKKIEG
ncbi:MAG: hypothetical protein Fur003_4440 [Candidatus Dojkabacteria bacterium]